MRGLTLKQEKILAYIGDFMRKTGYPPTIREIGKRFKIASSSVFDHLRALEGKGVLKRRPGRSRSIVIARSAESATPFGQAPVGRSVGRHRTVGSAKQSTNPEIASGASRPRNDTPSYPYLVNEETIQVPLVGRVAAGVPLLADENVEEIITFPRRWVSSGQIFALRVQGDSMIDDGIHNGDCVLVKMQPNADNGDIVIALLGEEATVKRFYRRGQTICLEAANAKYADLLVHDIKILGKVIGLFRTYA